MRHEEAAAFAAPAEAAPTDEPAVCAASCGPGNLHLINGLFDATAAACPSWRSPRTSPECSFFCDLTGSDEQFPRRGGDGDAGGASGAASAVVVVPGDVLSARMDDPGERPPICAARGVARPSDDALEAAAATRCRRRSSTRCAARARRVRQPVRRG